MYITMIMKLVKYLKKERSASQSVTLAKNLKKLVIHTITQCNGRINNRLVFFFFCSLTSTNWSFDSPLFKELTSECI